jgi:uncharacterized glyoxalase superfamily protein PhnB
MKKNEGKKNDQQQANRSSASEMVSNRSMPDAVVIPELAYPDVREAAAWLCEVFGFQERLQIGDHRAQLTYKQGAVIVTQRGDQKPHAAEADTSPPGKREKLTHAIMVRVDEIDEHYQRAVQRGAKIIHPPADYPYGERQYTVEDPGGHIWTFSQTIADIDPSEWGGNLIDRR